MKKVAALVVASFLVACSVEEAPYTQVPVSPAVEAEKDAKFVGEVCADHIVREMTVNGRSEDYGNFLALQCIKLCEAGPYKEACVKSLEDTVVKAANAARQGQLRK